MLLLFLTTSFTHPLQLQLPTMHPPSFLSTPFLITSIIFSCFLFFLYMCSLSLLFFIVLYPIFHISNLYGIVAALLDEVETIHIICSSKLLPNTSNDAQFQLQLSIADNKCQRNVHIFLQSFQFLLKFTCN